MIVLKILLAVVLVIFLLGLVRVGGDAEYGQDGARVRVRVGPVRFQVFPAKKPKKEKAKKEKPEKKKKPKQEGSGTPPKEGEKPEEPKAGGKLDMVKAGLPLLGDAAGALKRKIRIDDLRMDLVFGGRDAAQTAIAYGMANAAIASILSIFEQNFEVKSHRIRTAPNFTAGTTTIWIMAAFSARIWQLVGFAARYGWRFYKNYKAVKATDTTKKEASGHGREEAHPQ